MLQSINNANLAQIPSSNFRKESVLVDEIKTVKDILSKPVDEEKLNRELNKENRRITIDRTYFEFSVHKPTNTIVVKIVDSETNEVIDEIPPEKILDLVAGLWKIAGLFVDRKI